MPNWLKPSPPAYISAALSMWLWVVAEDERWLRQFVASKRPQRAPEIESSVPKIRKPRWPSKPCLGAARAGTRTPPGAPRPSTAPEKLRCDYLPNWACARANSLLTTAPANEISSASAEAQIISASLREPFSPVQPSSSRLRCCCFSRGPTDRADGWDRGHAQGNEQVAADFLVRADADAVFRHAGDVLSEREVQCGECVEVCRFSPTTPANWEPRCRSLMHRTMSSTSTRSSFFSRALGTVQLLIT